MNVLDRASSHGGNADSVDDRVYLRVVLTGLELDYARLRDAQLPRQG
jgi:hypothetical protein